MVNTKKEILIKMGLLLGDVVVTQIALFLALLLRNPRLLPQLISFSEHFLLVYVLWFLILFFLNFYDPYYFKKVGDLFINVVIFSVVALLIAASYFYFFSEAGITPKTILLLYIAIFSATLFAWRWLLGRMLRTTLLRPSDIEKDDYEALYKKVPLDALSELWFTKNVNPKQMPFEEFMKRFIDFAVGCVGLLLFAFLFPIIALIIKADSKGSVLFQQQRVGQYGRVFTLYKFRTMQQPLDDRQQELWREKSAGNITRVGAVLRRLHLDELPQAWSMVKGDISFVGPRPEWIELATIFEKEIPFYTKRYLVKPGIIGWAQINYPASRSVNEVKEKFQYDLYYIKNRSLLLDFEIMLKAVKLFFW